jgi:hypothetical protein
MYFEKRMNFMLLAKKGSRYKTKFGKRSFLLGLFLREKKSSQRSKREKDQAKRTKKRVKNHVFFDVIFKKLSYKTTTTEKTTTSANPAPNPGLRRQPIYLLTNLFKTRGEGCLFKLRSFNHNGRLLSLFSCFYSFIYFSCHSNR